MRDLDIRGAGNMLGGEQSGFMVEMGFEMYQKILDEAIRELKRTSFKELFKEEIAKQEQEVAGLYHRYRSGNPDSRMNMWKALPKDCRCIPDWIIVKRKKN